jgi:hypothetical protein
MFSLSPYFFCNIRLEFADYQKSNEKSWNRVKDKVRMVMKRLDHNSELLTDATTVWLSRVTSMRYVYSKSFSHILFTSTTNRLTANLSLQRPMSQNPTPVCSSFHSLQYSEFLLWAQILAEESDALRIKSGQPTNNMLVSENHGLYPAFSNCAQKYRQFFFLRIVTFMGKVRKLKFRNANRWFP